MDPLARALRFTRSTGDALADSVVRVPCGTVLRAPSTPGAWSSNLLRIERPAPELTLEGAAALHEVHAGHVDYRHVRIEDEPTAGRLTAEARSAGWRVDTELYMELRGTPPAPPPGAPVRRGTLDEVLALTRTWYAEAPEVRDDALEELVVMARRAHVAHPATHVVADHDGRPAAMCTLFSAGGVAQLEDVYVLPHARGAGLGRAVTAEAARVAVDTGHDLVFIVADDDDWPRQLYSRLGFAGLGRAVGLHRPAD